MKSGYILRILSDPKRILKDHVTPGEPSTSTARPNRYGRKTMLCVWWDQKDVIYYELLKPGETVNTKRYRQKIINLNQALCEKRPKHQKRQHKVILFMIMHHHTQQNWSRKRLRHLVGKYFRMRLTHQIWLHPITTYLHRWDMHLLSSASFLTKMYENG